MATGRPNIAIDAVGSLNAPVLAGGPPMIDADELTRGQADALWKKQVLEQPCPYGSGQHTWTPAPFNEAGKRCPSCGLTVFDDGRVEIG